MSLKSIGQAPGTRAHINEDFLQDFSRVFLAYFATTDDEFYVLSNLVVGGVTLKPNVPHPTFPQAVVLDLDAELVAPRITYEGDNSLASLWRATVKYGPWDPLTHAVDGNPVNLPVRFYFDFTVAEKVAFEDVDGDPIVNSAGDPYDPPLMREVLRATLNVERNELASTVNIVTLQQLSNTLNVATWNSFPAKTVRLSPMKIPMAEYSQVTNQYFYPMKYVFEIDWDTWVKQILNAGFRQLDSSGNLIPILVNGQPATTPVPLDESGHAILTPASKDSSGDTPPDASDVGYSGEVTGGAEAPEGGTGDTGTGEDGSTPTIIIDAYDLIRCTDFGVLNLNTLFTLPTL
jgi:hypothetical protein